MRLSLRAILSVWLLCLLISLNLSQQAQAQATHTQTFEEDRCRIIKAKACVDFGKRIVDGIESKDECWKYEEQYYCIAKEKNDCEALENNRGCHEINSTCLEQSDIGLCKNLEKKFSCGKKLEEKSEIKLIDTQFKTLRDEKDLASCSAKDINQYCEAINEVCVEPKEVRNINGKLVEKDCWKWEKKYACRSSSIVDECKDLDKDCQLTGERTCLHSLRINGKDTCVHFENKVNCTSMQEYKKPCIATKFCIGDICEVQTRTQYRDFAHSMSKLAILASMKSDNLDGCKCPNGKQTCEANEMDPGDCRLFSGEAKQCHKSTSQHNCCSEKGFIRDIIHCTGEEKDLFELRKNGLCHLVGSWNGKSLKDTITFTSYQSYCCFKSKMARIINAGGKAQLGINWGDEKHPYCRPLTLEEIRRIDFSRLDFSEMFTDIENHARAKVSQTQENIKNKMNETQGNPAAMSEIINKKISKFYGGVK